MILAKISTYINKDNNLFPTVHIQEGTVTQEIMAQISVADYTNDGIAHIDKNIKMTYGLREPITIKNAKSIGANA